ncbi:MAG: response regulator [Oligoflexales bacterium]
MQKLLLVEDDANVLEHLKTFLNDEWIVITASNGQEGAARFLENPDIVGVLTDLHMPIMSGFEMLRKIRMQPNGLKPVFLAFSGYFDDESIESLNELGKVIKLVKPVSGERLKQVMKAAILFEDLGDREKSTDNDRKKNILVVDDSPGIRQAFKEYFVNSPDYHIYLASDAKEGEEVFVSGKQIDFIFSDIEMGEVNGLQFISRIRNLAKGELVPVVIMSTYVNQELKKEGESLGVLAYLNKPFHLESVAKVIKLWIAKSAKQEIGKGSLTDVFQKLLSSSNLPEETKDAFKKRMQKYLNDLNLRKDGLLNEIIEREKIENLMIRNNIAMQELTDQKAKIVRMLCHDLSNSITIIKASALREKKYLEPSANHKNLDRILRAVSNVEDMVSQVKTLEAVSTGKETLKLEPVNLKNIFDEVEFTFEEKLKEKSMKLDFLFDKKQDYFVEADRISLINQVLNNVISNAIKFSLKGGTIRTSIDKMKNNRLKVSIQDYGIGMPETLVRGLFSFNEKTSRPGTNNEQGTGFGMPLVKSFMDSYGGEVKIESTEKSSEEDVHGTIVHLYFKVPESKR